MPAALLASLLANGREKYNPTLLNRPNLLKRWCRLCGSNTRPTAYKAVALPLS